MLNNLELILNNPNILLLLIIWSILWKGLALWRAARLKQLGWYIALLLINTIGIFEILYLIFTNNKYKTTDGYVS